MKKEIVLRLLKAEYITFDEALELMTTEKEFTSYPYYPTYPYFIQNPIIYPTVYITGYNAVATLDSMVTHVYSKSNT